MQQIPDRLSVFLSAVDGDWKNAIYIDCHTQACPQHAFCGGVLFAADEDGSPILLPVSDFRRMTGEPVEKAACHGQLDRAAFEAAFRCFINWRTESDGNCALCQLLAVQPYPIPAQIPAQKNPPNT